MQGRLSVYVMSMIDPEFDEAEFLEGACDAYYIGEDAVVAPCSVLMHPPPPPCDHEGVWQCGMLLGACACNEIHSKFHSWSQR